MMIDEMKKKLDAMDKRLEDLRSKYRILHWCVEIVGALSDSDAGVVAIDLSGLSSEEVYVEGEAEEKILQILREYYEARVKTLTAELESVL